MTTAIVAQTKERAERLAQDLGIGDALIFGAKMERAFEGLRADLVIVDADAKISDRFMHTIRATVAKVPGGGGRVEFVRDCRLCGTPTFDCARCRRCDAAGAYAGLDAWLASLARPGTQPAPQPPAPA